LPGLGDSQKEDDHQNLHRVGDPWTGLDYQAFENRCLSLGACPDSGQALKGKDQKKNISLLLLQRNCNASCFPAR